MPVRKYRPTSPGRRFQSVATFEEVTKRTPEKSLLVPLRKTGGRNALGRITCRHRGGGHRQMYRRIDFKRDKHNIPAKVAAIEYDPNRSARIALLHYADGEKRYILAPLGLQVGNQGMSGPPAEGRGGVVGPRGGGGGGPPPPPPPPPGGCGRDQGGAAPGKGPPVWFCPR